MLPVGGVGRSISQRQGAHTCVYHKYVRAPTKEHIPLSPTYTKKTRQDKGHAGIFIHSLT
jgi:hypothetical protein